MKKVLPVLLSLVALWGLTSCEVVDPPAEETKVDVFTATVPVADVGGWGTTTNPTLKVILVPPAVADQIAAGTITNDVDLFTDANKVMIYGNNDLDNGVVIATEAEAGYVTPVGKKHTPENVQADFTYEGIYVKKEGDNYLVKIVPSQLKITKGLFKGSAEVNAVETDSIADYVPFVIGLTGDAVTYSTVKFWSTAMIATTFASEVVPTGTVSAYKFVADISKATHIIGSVDFGTGGDWSNNLHQALTFTGDTATVDVTATGTDIQFAITEGAWSTKWTGADIALNAAPTALVPGASANAKFTGLTASTMYRITIKKDTSLGKVFASITVKP